MKKTLIASAVAAATLSTGAMADGVTFYGDIEAFATYTSSDFGGTNGLGAANSDTDSTLGLKASHELSPGLKGFAKVEYDYSLANGALNLDEAYFGVEGDFGKVWAGDDDSLYEMVDIIDFSSGINNITYAAGDMAGVNEAATVKFLKKMDNVTLGLEAQTADVMGDLGVVYLGYAADAITVDFAYAMSHRGAEDTIGLAATFAADENLTVGLQYETEKDTGSLVGAIANYGMGATSLVAMVSQYMEDGAGADTTTLGVGAYHNLGDNLQLWVEMAGEDIDGDDTNQEYVVGATYSF